MPRYKTWVEQVEKDYFKACFRYDDEPKEMTSSPYASGSFYETVKFIRKIDNFFDKLEIVKKAITDAGR